MQNGCDPTRTVCLHQNTEREMLESYIRNGIVPHGFRKLTISSLQQDYFVVATLFQMSHPFFMMLDLQLSFYCTLYYNSRVHCPLLQCLCTTSAILAGAHSYFVVSSFKCEGKNSYHDLNPNPYTFFLHMIYYYLNTSRETFPKVMIRGYCILIKNISQNMGKEKGNSY